MPAYIPCTFALCAKLVSFTAAVSLALALWVGSSSVAHAQTEMRSIPVVVVTALIRDAFDGTTIRLNGYGTVNNPFVENDSVISLGPQLGGATQRFTIFPAFQPRKPYYFYVSDINLLRITVSQDRRFIRVGLIFEEDGVELKGLCRGSPVECPLGRDDTVPDVHINNFRVDVLLEPWALDGSLSYRRAIVRLLGEPQAGGVCKLGVDICDALFKYKSQIRENTERTIQTFLQQPAIRQRLAAATRPTLDSNGIGQVLFVQIRGANLEISHRP